MKAKTAKLNIISFEEMTDSDVISDIEHESIELKSSLDKTESDIKTLYTSMTEDDAPEKYKEEVNVRLRSYNRAAANCLKTYQKILLMTDELSARWGDLARQKKKSFLPKAPANSVIDLKEQREDYFAKGLSLYKLLLVCYIGCFVGVIIEMLWCLLKNGYIESRAGLVYGPFNLLYGVGAAAMTFFLYRFRNRGKWLSFIGGFLVGSILEYGCSFIQELLFGSTSWDYSSKPFNLNGRICLLYSIFWGILGVFWVKTIYPWMAKLLLKLPNKIGKIITVALTVFFVFNSVVTAVAVFRWSQRIEKNAPDGVFWSFIDSRFPDERMERIFANTEYK